MAGIGIVELAILGGLCLVVIAVLALVVVVFRRAQRPR